MTIQTNTSPTTTSTAITGPGIDTSKRVGCRHVDLGREDELVTWAEWFQRSADTLESFLASAIAQAKDAGADTSEQLDDHGRPFPDAARVFRVSLKDGRTFAVSAVQTHTSRGRCFPGDNDRWAQDSEGSKPTCDVITGYTLVGAGPDGRPTALSVPPEHITSVEAVLVPRNAQNQALNAPSKDETEAFGFARFAQMRDRPELSETDDS